MRVYTVFWHYISNHGTCVREADSPEDACRQVVRGFSEEFGRKAELVAVEGIHLMRKATAYDPAAEILATQGCSFLLRNGRRGVVKSRWVTNLAERFVGKFEDSPEHTPIRTIEVVEFMPEDGPGCNAGGGVR